jgi:hypothetical protein
MSELEIVSPPEKQIEFLGRKIALTPITMGKLQRFTIAVRPIAADLFLALEGSGDVVQTIELHGERMIEAVSIATGIEQTELESVLPDDFLKLAEAVVEVNADFFVRRLIPSLMPLFVRAVVAINNKLKVGTA